MNSACTNTRNEKWFIRGTSTSLLNKMSSVYLILLQTGHQKNIDVVRIDKIWGKYVETYSSSNVMAPDAEERVLYYTHGKNMATEQLLKLKHKGITSASDKRKMTESFAKLLNSPNLSGYPITV